MWWKILLMLNVCCLSTYALCSALSRDIDANLLIINIPFWILTTIVGVARGVVYNKK